MDDAFDYAALCAGLEQLYRFFGVLPRVIGRSALGRAVFAVDLGKRTPHSLLLGGVCGDPETSRLLLRFTEALLRHRHEGLPFFGVDLRRAMQSCGVTVVPCLNPDGGELAVHGLSSAGVLCAFLRPLLENDSRWQSNALGVDLRHQFAPGFASGRERGVEAPCAAGFGGEMPCSEAESRAIVALCDRERFRHAVLLQPGDAALFAHAPQESRLFSLGTKLLAQELGVVPQHAATPDGGFPCWFSAQFHRPAYTIQTGKETTPLPEKMLFSCLLLSMLL